MTTVSRLPRCLPTPLRCPVHSGGSRARRALAVAMLGATLTLVACTPNQDATDPTVAEAGYEAGDGTYTTWAPEDRTEAPVIAGETFAGEPLDIADWRGDVVVLNFWYAACPPCRAEAPDFAAVANDYADDGVHLLGINGTDDAATADAFAATFAIPYPSLNDSSASAVAALEGLVPLKAMPTTVILDREGRPAARIIGPASGITLRSLIDDIAAES